MGNTYYQWGVRELDPNPGRDLVRITDTATVINPDGVVGTMTYRSQNWLINKTDGANWFLNTSYITGSHSLKFGYQGNWWKDDRGEYTNNQSLAYTFTGGRRLVANDPTSPFIPSTPSSITEYHEPVPQQRACGHDVVLRPGSMDAEAPHAAGWDPLRPSRGVGSPPSISRRAGSSPACTSTRRMA